jgi:hypothetical protein
MLVLPKLQLAPLPHGVVRVPSRAEKLSTHPLTPLIKTCDRFFMIPIELQSIGFIWMGYYARRWDSRLDPRA